MFIIKTIFSYEIKHIEKVTSANTCHMMLLNLKTKSVFRVSINPVNNFTCVTVKQIICFISNQNFQQKQYVLI